MTFSLEKDYFGNKYSETNTFLLVQKKKKKIQTPLNNGLDYNLET